MNKVIMLLAFAVASSAYACPELSGKYVCTINGQALQTDILQSAISGVMVYNITQNNQAWSDVVTDGVEREFKGVEGMENALYTASCPNEEQVVINAKGKVMDNGQAIGDLALVLKVSKDAAANLVLNVTGELSGDFGNMPIDEQVNTCVRQ